MRRDRDHDRDIAETITWTLLGFFTLVTAAIALEALTILDRSPSRIDFLGGMLFGGVVALLWLWVAYARPWSGELPSDRAASAYAAAYECQCSVCLASRVDYQATGQ